MNGDRPTVSVVTAAFNAEETLGRMFSSMAAQTMTDLEHVVVDDGSRDRTAERVVEEAHRDRRIRLVRKANGGASAARNSGLAKARGEWVIFLDADDTIAPDHLIRLVRAGRNGADAVSSGFRRVAADGRVVASHAPVALGAWSLNELIRRPPAIHSILVRRCRLAEVGDFDEDLKCAEDLDLWLRLARYGIVGTTVSSRSADYWSRSGQLTFGTAGVLRDTARVLERLRSPDLRVPGSAGPVVEATTVERAILRCASWCIGAEIGAVRSSTAAHAVPPVPAALQAPLQDLVDAFVDGLVVGSGLVHGRLHREWDALEEPIHTALSELEARLEAPGYRAGFTRALEREIVRLADLETAALVGGTLAVPAGVFGPRRHVPRDPTKRILIKADFVKPRSLSLVEWQSGTPIRLSGYWSGLISNVLHRLNLRLRS